MMPRLSNYLYFIYHTIIIAFVDSKAYSTETNFSRHFFFSTQAFDSWNITYFFAIKIKLQTLDIASRYKTGAVTPQAVINDESY